MSPESEEGVIDAAAAPAAPAVAGDAAGVSETEMASQRTVAAIAATLVGLGPVMRSVVAGGAPQQTTPAAAVTTIPADFVPATDSPEMSWWRESMKTHDQRIAWWRQARFGMFIHWGVYSELGGEWHGQPVVGYAEHIMRKSRIPIDVYRRDVAGQFNPTKFNADEWVKLAHDAGMGYIVITSKHHDGFAMYDSEVSDFNVVKQTPWHHDPMKDLKEATARQGIRFGFYYSQAWDWADPDGTGNDWDYDCPCGDRGLHGGKNWWEQSPAWVARVQKYVQNKAIPQVHELLAKYHPDVIWFDTDHKMAPALNFEVFKATREADPNVVINSRCVPNLGDYVSTADRPAELAPHDGDWEAIPTTNESYGWHKQDHSHKPAEHFITLIAKCAARGGNLMLNVGPRGDGTIDPADVAILHGIARWMKINGESIHGTSRTPLAVQSWGESTVKGNRLYLHVFDWPSDGKLIVGGVKSNVKSAYLLSDTSKTALKLERMNDLDVRIAVPTAAPDPVDSVVVVDCQGEVTADPTRLLCTNNHNVLRVFDGQLVGHTIRFGQGKKENAYVEQWMSSGDAVAWPVRVNEAVKYNVTAIYDAEAPSAGGAYAIRVGGQTLQGNVIAGSNQTQSLGTVQLQAGEHQIRVEPVRIAGGELMRLRSLVLSRAGNETARR